MHEGRKRWSEEKFQSSVLASVLADDLIVGGMIPHACPCDFGPEGRYRLEELVAANERSLVYRAKDARLSGQGFRAEVAVKVFRPGMDRSHEALSGRRITHPNVLRVLDRGVSEDGYSFVVSEYIDGGDLSAKSGAWPAKDAARFMAKLCRGVQAAHAAGVVHCDLKPANVMLTRDNEPKLVDFDLARSESNASHAVRGNIAFMAPEQFVGEENCLAPPADIYALGGMFYLLLTGKVAHGETLPEVERFHAQGSLPPSAGAGSVLDAIVRRAMRKDLNERYPSAAQLADDLEAWLAHRPIAWMRPGLWTKVRLWSSRRPALAVASAASLLSLAGGLWTWRVVVEREYQRELAAIQRDHQRDLESQRLANVKANEMVEEIKARVRATLRTMIVAMDPKKAEEIDTKMIPALTWVEWLANEPVIAASGEVAAVPERIMMMQNAIVLNEADGRATHTDTMILRYALVQMLIVDGRSDEAATHVDLLEAWSDSFAKNDPLRKTVEVMRACMEAETKLGNPTDIAARLAKLQSLASEIGEQPGMDRAVRMVRAVLKRLMA